MCVPNQGCAFACKPALFQLVVFLGSFQRVGMVGSQLGYSGVCTVPVAVSCREISEVEGETG